MTAPSRHYRFHPGQEHNSQDPAYRYRGERISCCSLDGNFLYVGRFIKLRLDHEEQYFVG
jgi:hypothetical protein